MDDPKDVGKPRFLPRDLRRATRAQLIAAIHLITVILPLPSLKRLYRWAKNEADDLSKNGED